MDNEVSPTTGANGKEEQNNKPHAFSITSIVTGGLALFFALSSIMLSFYVRTTAVEGWHDSGWQEGREWDRGEWGEWDDHDEWYDDHGRSKGRWKGKMPFIQRRWHGKFGLTTPLALVGLVFGILALTRGKERKQIIPILGIIFSAVGLFASHAASIIFIF